MLRPDERRLKIALALKSRDWLTAQELADQLGVSVRTIYRDVDELKASGIPIQSLPGLEGGYRLSPESPIDPSVFSSDDALVTYLLDAEYGLESLEAAIRDSIGPSTEEGAAAQTIVDGLARLRERVLFDTVEWYWRDESALYLPDLRRAVLGSEVCDVEYAPDDDKTSSVLLLPLGVVWKGGEWYLCAQEYNGPILKFRVNRFRKVTLTGLHFDYPASFNLRDWWTSELEDYGKGGVEVRLRVGARAAMHWRRFNTKQESTVEILDDGGLRITLLLDYWDWLIPLVVDFGGEVLVETPDDLRGQVAEYARRVCELHSQTGGTPASAAFRPGDDSQLRASRARGPHPG